MAPQQQSAGRSKKKAGSGKKAEKASSATAAAPAPIAAPTTITIKVRSSAARAAEGPEEFGSVWFRNHNPNAAAVSSTVPPSSSSSAASCSGNPLASNVTTVSQSACSSSTLASSQPSAVSQSHVHTTAQGVPLGTSRRVNPAVVAGLPQTHAAPSQPAAPSYELACIPPWALYRLPPAAPATPPPPPPTPIQAGPSSVGCGVMSSSAQPFEVPPASSPTATGMSTPPPPPHPMLGGVNKLPAQLYAYTIDGLSTEMYDFVNAMRLSTEERAARECLRERIEKVVASLWPMSAHSEGCATPCGYGGDGGRRRASAQQRDVLSSFSTPSLDSLVSSTRSSGTATPVPNEEEACSGPTSSTPLHLSAEAPIAAGEAVGDKLSASVILFGSYALDLATPSSDLDLSVVFANSGANGTTVASSSGAAVDGAAGNDGGSAEMSEEELQFQRFTARTPSFEVLRLREIAEAFQHDEDVEVRVLEECHVPVAHIVDLPTGISADVSINMPHMTHVVGMQRAWLAEEEAAERAEATEGGAAIPDISKVKAMIILTKLALRQWGVSCSFTGGLSSTGVYLLVERYLREGRDAGCVPTPLPPLGRLLIDFWAYLSSDMFQHGFLATDIFHISNNRSTTTTAAATAAGGSVPHLSAVTSHVASVLSSPREAPTTLLSTLDALSAEFVPTPNNLSPVTLDAPGAFPTVPVAPAATMSRTASNLPSMSTALLPDVTRRCTRMGEIQFLFRHSATTLEQLVMPGPRSVWSLPPTPLSSVLADPRQCAPPCPKRLLRHQTIYRPPKSAPRDHSEGGTPIPSSDRSSTPGASSNGSDGAVSPSVKVSGSPVKFTSSLKDFVGAPCFVPKKLIAVSPPPPPEYQPPAY